MKERKFFYCGNEHCLSWSFGDSGRLPVSEIGQTVLGKTLCTKCYAAGYRLVPGVVVKKNKAGK